MGNDGGSIPKRRELVKEAARNPTASEQKETRQEQQDYLWKTDPLSHCPLARPIVSDSLGRLFNKDSVIEFLLPSEVDNITKRGEQENFMQGTVKSLKDVVEVKFEVEQAMADNAKARGNGEERWICPVTNKELGRSTRAVYLVPCGHAFSDAALKEVVGEKCLQCNEQYAPIDVIPILSTSETDIARLALRAESLKERGLAHSLKKVAGKSRKCKVPGTEVPNAVVQNVPVALIKQDETPRLMYKSSTPQPGSGTHTPTLSLKNAVTASLTAKVLEEQGERNKRRKNAKNENLSSLFSATSDTSTSGNGKNNDFMSRGYAIPTHQHRLKGKY